MAFTDLLSRLVETDQEETERLSQAQPTSINGMLAQLPVTMREHPQGKPVLLPRLGANKRTMVVLPTTFHRSSSHEARKARGEKSLHDGVWYCVVIQSDDPHYPVGGYDIVVSQSELRRGRLVQLSVDYDAEFAK